MAVGAAIGARLQVARRAAARPACRASDKGSQRPSFGVSPPPLRARRRRSELVCAAQPSLINEPMRGATLAVPEPDRANRVLRGPGTVMTRSGVVQLVERRPLEPVVAGSSPAPRAKLAQWRTPTAGVAITIGDAEASPSRAVPWLASQRSREPFRQCGQRSCHRQSADLREEAADVCGVAVIGHAVHPPEVIAMAEKDRVAGEPERTAGHELGALVIVDADAPRLAHRQLHGKGSLRSRRARSPIRRP